MPSPVSWNLRLAVHDGQLENFRTLMHEMVESTRQESGTLSYESFLSEDGSTCHLHERYADSAAALVHLGNFGTKFAERFLACVQPTEFTVYGDPSDDVRQAVAGFGAVHLGTFGGFSR